MSNYAWVITRDHLAEGSNMENESGTMGPQGISEAQKRALIAGEGEEFRLYDDDDYLYYSGRVIGEMDMGDPLLDFGAPNAGAAYMSMRSAEGEWIVVIG